MQILLKAQSEFIFSAIAETYNALNCAAFFDEPSFIDDLVGEYKFKMDAVSRFMNAAAFVGVCKKNKDGKFQHLEEKSFNRDLSVTLFELFSSKVLKLMPVSLELVENNEKDLIKKACAYGLLINIDGQITIPAELVSFYDRDSSDYIGPLLMHYKKIMLPMYSCEGIKLGLKTGKSQWQHFFGKDIKNQFEAYVSEPELLEVFTTALHYMNLKDNAALITQVNLPPTAKILDLGGGSGALAGSIADVYSSCLIDIYELEEAIPMFKKIIEATNKKSCINFISGDFKKDTKTGYLWNLEKVNYDAIFLSWILHDWDDETCINILKKAKLHLINSGNIYILEGILPDNRVGRECLIDIAMLLQTEGRERTFKEYKSLLNAAGFKKVSSIKTPGRRDIIMAKNNEF